MSLAPSAFRCVLQQMGVGDLLKWQRGNVSGRSTANKTACLSRLRPLISFSRFRITRLIVRSLSGECDSKHAEIPCDKLTLVAALKASLGIEWKARKKQRMPLRVFGSVLRGGGRGGGGPVSRAVTSESSADCCRSDSLTLDLRAV